MIELLWADLCSDCPVIWDRRTSRVCPKCARPSVLHLATVLNRRSTTEVPHARVARDVARG